MLNVKGLDVDTMIMEPIQVNKECIELTTGLSSTGIL